MKLIYILILFVSASVRGQQHEIQQLLLNVEKLAQFKQILSDMQQGYEVLSQGYNTIKNISEGNFNLHEGFIDGLLRVSPAVQKYNKVRELVRLQKEILDESKRIRKMLLNTEWFQAGELDHARHLAGRAISQAAENILVLTDIITSSKLRMSDAERLSMVDRLYLRMDTRLSHLRRYGSQMRMLAMQRAREQKDIDALRRIYGF